MAELTAADRLDALLARAPKESDYMRSRTSGGRNPITTQTLDEAKFRAARDAFQANYGPAIKALQDQIGMETMRMGLSTQAASGRANYLSSPTHATFQDYASVPPAAGALAGYTLARTTTPRAAPGASLGSRALLMGGPLAEATLGPVVDYLGRRVQGENPTAHGEDVNAAVGSAGLGESAGAIAGGLYQLKSKGSAASTSTSAAQAAAPEAAQAAELAFTRPEVNMTYGGRGMAGQSNIPLSYNTAAPDVAKEAETAARYTGRHLDVAADVASDLGLTPGGSKGDMLKQLLAHIPKADEDMLRAVARKTDGAVDATASLRSLRTQMKSWVGGTLTKRNRITSIAAPLAAGAGAAYALMSPDETEAAVGPTEGRRRDQTLTQYRLAQLGLPSTADEAKEAALDLAPVTSEWRLGKALGQAAYDIPAAAYQKLTAPGPAVDISAADPRLARFHSWLDTQRSAHQMAAAKNSYAAQQAAPPGDEPQHALAP
jgi:hypothetical protein